MLLAALAGGSASAQTTYPNVRLSGRLQAQFYYFSNEDYAATTDPRATSSSGGPGSRPRGQISENVAVYIQPSFEGGRNLSRAGHHLHLDSGRAGGGTPVLTCRTTGRSGLRLRDAYIDVRFSPEASKGALYLRAGQEKRPFSRYELTSSTNLPSIERGAGQGLLARASNDLFGGGRLPLP